MDSGLRSPLSGDLVDGASGLNGYRGREPNTGPGPSKFPDDRASRGKAKSFLTPCPDAILDRNVSGTYVIRREGDRILGGTPGRPFVLLMAETRDMLFEPDNVYKRDVFQRDANGRVTGFIMRNENTDRTWVRIGA